MNIEVLNINFKADDLHIDLLYNENKFSLVLRKMPSIKDEYWTSTFFHDYEHFCDLCKSEGYYDKNNSKKTNRYLPCTYFDNHNLDVLESIYKHVRMPFLLKNNYDFREVIESIKNRKDLFKIKK